ncbi:tRNA (adenosine(37)-N6)-threonylcarbamoyltransferase complex dimerization subunit type 1 TsaB [Saliterribacillus persicus]|uniref:tRNA threonylcarbamoyladenosine biosynthesis protein TsaB n=1 Tax=Saliterribacillus persicus TaxID=930114 RepID=A0A368X398_9BACI|nr:tRNA (adenosine(37)-N6)-threonylcarbamoyltransferase complex dimerization subunit type 1 TsaB [Saliterribacillus persicus]RCW62199.1 tRNA threonylcarbamoyladenosine biosynthesis protein TsaB [Saliterribacillus persicus]
MNILAIDTSNQVMTVAITRGGELIAETIINVKRNHSVGLMPAIDNLLKDANMLPKELDKIVVAKGPGSYTGVRIGLSTAKTMAWTLNIPVIGVSSLEILARNFFQSQDVICPFFDARRGLVYTGLYQETNLKKEEQNLLFSDWLVKLKDVEGKILFVSPDLSIHKETIKDILKEKAVFPPAIFHVPRASVLAEIAEEKEIEDVHALTPNYLRMVEAEAIWLKEQAEKNND